MRHLRHVFLVAAVLVAGAISAAPAGAQPFVRQSLAEFSKDPEKMESLMRGIAVMKARNSTPKDSADYRRSWEYWSAIHDYVGPTGNSIQDWIDFLAQNNPLNAPLYASMFSGLRELDRPTEPPGVAEKTWGSCQHGTPHFLSWHRMYLYFFERVLREASGDPNLTLPYWDYTNPAVDPDDRAAAPHRIPSEYIFDGDVAIDGQTVANPLFERRRTAFFGLGLQIDTVSTEIDSALLVDQFFPFQTAIERGIHGLIHCSVGNSCLAPTMGLTPFAASDPIFWHHHANIDRMWSCWTTLHGREANPVGEAAWMDQEYFFVDEKGDLVSMKVAELFDPNGRIDYVYDNEGACLRRQPQAQASIEMFRQAGARVVSRVARATEVAITEEAQAVSLAPSAGAGPDAVQRLFFAMHPSVMAPSRALLRLDNISSLRAPGASIDIFLDAGGEDRAFVGVVSFFAQAGPGHHDHGEGGSVLFEVSQQLQELGGAGDNLRVVLVAAGGVTGDLPTALLDSYRQSGVTIGEIALDVETAAGGLLDLK